MLIISKFPKSIVGCTKCRRGRHAARVPETPEFILDIYFVTIKACIVRVQSKSCGVLTFSSMISHQLAGEKKTVLSSNHSPTCT